MNIDMSPSCDQQMLAVVVGKEEATCQIRREALARLSKTLDQVQSGDYYETKRWEGLLSMISLQTFTRFRDFAYNGDYQDLKPMARPKGWQRPDEKMMRDALYRRRGRNSETDQKLRKDSCSDTDAEYEMVERPPPAQSAVEDSPQPMSIERAFKQQTFSTERLTAQYRRIGAPVVLSSLSAKRSDYLVPALQAHVELYLFARELEVRELQVLCLKRIHTTLVECEATQDTICDVVQIVDFKLFKKDFDYISSAADPPLMSLFAQWFVWRVANTKFGRQTEFTRLLVENDFFVEEFWKYLYQWKLDD